VERRLAYEESIRIPLIMRYPKLVKAGSKPTEIALNIDIAPTMLELAGVPIPTSVEGRSLVPVLRGRAKNWRQSFLIEHAPDNVFPRTVHMAYQCVRTSQWKYIHYTELSGMDELYNLQKDPYEMKNLIEDPAAMKPLAELQKRLLKLVKVGLLPVEIVAQLLQSSH
jgi:N-acetylglucosamine-6-sulfatase